MKLRLDTRSTEYNTVHQYMLRHYNKSGQCLNCKKITRTHWSNKDGQYNREDITTWQELCPKCHKQYDARDKYQKKCGYCRRRSEDVDYYMLPPRKRANIKIKLCPDCWRLEQLTQEYYDGKISKFVLFVELS